VVALLWVLPTPHIFLTTHHPNSLQFLLQNAMEELGENWVEGSKTIVG
jgi:hypothetical protein